MASATSSRRTNRDDPRVGQVDEVRDSQVRETQDGTVRDGRQVLVPLHDDGPPDGVEERLGRAGLDVNALERSPSLVRLHVGRGAEMMIVDLVAEPVPFAVAPRPERVGAATILVDTAHEILVNKLGALVSPSELRDLQGVCALIRAGGDLERALTDAARKYGGMSAATLAWVLEQLPVEALGSALGFTQPDLGALKAERDDLVDRLVALARPER